ncbi:glycosyl transferase group 1 (plasmid) [Gemmatirosa kalamazoonensis]|uniref:Glycosyl transferase group 1 n=2 Tax=Gemmatirosa kalamazoonensis TaxID=861299 RepID=W0RRI7_9BACT|nr:glycosyl transferase group 1 [Gemmatirosa kalamazoonensis]
MNVLFAVPWDNIGGVSHVVNRVAHHVRAQGGGVYFLLPGSHDRPESGVSREGFPAFWLRMRLPWVPGASLRNWLAFFLTLPVTLFWLTRLIRRHSIDVVNIHYPGGHFVYFAILRRFGVVRLVTSIHGADLLPNGSRRLSHQREVLNLLATSDVIVAPSDSYTHAVHEAWPELTGPTRTIPNGVDPDELGYNPDAPDETAHPPIVFSILQMVHYKGVDVLIRAFAGLSARYPKVKLRLASDGPQRADFEALAESLGVGHRVEFLGFLAREDVSRELRRCSIFVLPSRTNSESFGIAAAEAMAVDRAVVASRVGGLPELVEDGVTGLLVPPGDVDALEQALRRLLDDEEFGQRLGQAAGKRVRQQYLWDRTGALYRDLFQELLPVPEASEPDTRGFAVPEHATTYRPPAAADRAERPADTYTAAPLTKAGTSQEGW